MAPVNNAAAVNNAAPANNVAPFNDAASIDTNAVEGASTTAEVPDEEFLFDMSSSFAYGLSLAEEAGFAPTWILTLGETRRRK